MAESMNTASAIEPDPIPRDVSPSAPIRGDIERGYNRENTLDDGLDIKEKDRTMSLGNEQDIPRKGSGATAISEKGKKVRGRGLTEGDAEMEALPKNNMLLVTPAIALVLFLAALDQTIVATALPTIASELGSTPAQYQWVGTSYTLAMTLQGPINGRVSDIVGRKPMLYAAIIIFAVFSALCGAAKSMTWLIVARAFQGLGGGAIIGLTNIVISDIVSLEKRGAYMGALGASWGVAAVVGPILGGVLTQKATWRWCFYINLPTCGVAFVMLLLTLKLNPTKRYTFRKLRQTFDFLGLFLMMIGGALLIVGFAQAADNGFNSPDAYGVIVGGALASALAIVNCLFTKRNAIIPARMFKNRTTLFWMIASLLQATAFLPANYLLPQMFQGVQGADALMSGLMLIPFAFCVAWCTVIAGQIHARLHIIRPVPWTGYALGGLGYGLFYGFYRYPISLATMEGLLVVTGVGIGLSLTSQLLILQAAMPLKDMAAATSAWSLTRSLGGSIGLAIFTAVLNTDLRSRFEKIPGYGTIFQVPQSAEGYHALHDLPDDETKYLVLSAFADSLGLCWIIACGMMLFCLVITIPTRSYSLNRSGGPSAPPASSAGDEIPEKSNGMEKEKESGEDDMRFERKLNNSGGYTTPATRRIAQSDTIETDSNGPSSEKTFTDDTALAGTTTKIGQGGS